MKVYARKYLFQILVTVSVNVINLVILEIDYKNCKRKKSLVNKLVEEYTENIDETKLVEINSTECTSVENKCKHNSCTIYIVSFSIIFTVSIEIGIYFLCLYCYLKKDVIFVKSGTRTQTTVS